MIAAQCSHTGPPSSLAYGDLPSLSEAPQPASLLAPKMAGMRGLDAGPDPRRRPTTQAPRSDHPSERGVSVFGARRLPLLITEESVYEATVGIGGLTSICRRKA